VCLSVTTKSATYHVYMRKTRCHRVLCGFFVVLLSLKTLHSRVMASFAGYRHFLTPYGELSVFPSTVMAYFQPQGHVSLAVYRLDPTIRLAHYFVLAHWQISFLTFLPSGHSHVSMLPLPRFSVPCVGRGLHEDVNIATPTFLAQYIKEIAEASSTLATGKGRQFGKLWTLANSADGLAPRVFIVMVIVVTKNSKCS
jgi:hypothetical protein